MASIFKRKRLRLIPSGAEVTDRKRRRRSNGDQDNKDDKIREARWTDSRGREHRALLNETGAAQG